MGLAYKDYYKEGSSNYAIRFKVPSNREFNFDDMIEVNYHFYLKMLKIGLSKEMEFTYNFAVVIDDHLMEISHVLEEKNI